MQDKADMHSKPNNSKEGFHVRDVAGHQELDVLNNLKHFKHANPF